jgi:type I restriction enzyme S subunit
MSFETLNWFDCDLPQNWEMTSLRAVFDEQTERSGEVQDAYLSLTANAGVIPYAEKGDVGNKAPEDMSKCKRVFPGDFVLNSMNFGIGSFGVSKHEGVCSSVYLVLKPKGDINERYLQRIFELPTFQKFAQSLGNGILAHRAAFGWDKLRTIQVPIPPLAEQDAIVEFLDRELAQIDALLSVQSRLKDLIEERLESRILKTVCGNTVETSNWLGALPIGWGKVPLREVATIQAGGTPTSDNETYWLDGDDAAGIPWLNIGDFDTNADITSTKQRVTALGAASKNLPVGPPGTIVFAMYASVGSVSRIGMRASWSQAILGIQTKKNYSDRYLYWVLRAFKNQLPFYFRSNTQNNINASQVRSFMLPYPPLDEQLSIAMRLDQKSKEDQFLLQKAQSLIDALTERRAAIIAEAVTGKVHIKETS